MREWCFQNGNRERIPRLLVNYTFCELSEQSTFWFHSPKVMAWVEDRAGSSCLAHRALLTMTVGRGVTMAPMLRLYRRNLG